MFVITGDSGGPLIFLDAPDGNEPEGDPSFDYIVGVVSFGPTKCGTRGIPGVYARVSCFSEWISCVINNPSDPSGCDGAPGGSCPTAQESTGCPDEMEVCCTLKQYSGTLVHQTHFTETQSGGAQCDRNALHSQIQFPSCC